jgi:hypothetical protein
MSIPMWPLLTIACMLGACGPDVASTAATTAKLEAIKVEQAKKQEEQLKKDLGAAMKNTEAAASAAGQQ